MRNEHERRWNLSTVWRCALFASTYQNPEELFDIHLQWYHCMMELSRELFCVVLNQQPIQNYEAIKELGWENTICSVNVSLNEWKMKNLFMAKMPLKELTVIKFDCCGYLWPVSCGALYTYIEANVTRKFNQSGFWDPRTELFQRWPGSQFLFSILYVWHYFSCVFRIAPERFRRMFLIRNARVSGTWIWNMRGSGLLQLHIQSSYAKKRSVMPLQLFFQLLLVAVHYRADRHYTKWVSIKSLQFYSHIWCAMRWSTFKGKITTSISRCWMRQSGDLRCGTLKILKRAWKTKIRWLLNRFLFYTCERYPVTPVETDIDYTSSWSSHRITGKSYLDSTYKSL